MGMKRVTVQLVEVLELQLKSITGDDTDSEQEKEEGKGGDENEDEGEDDDGNMYKDHRKIIDLDWINRQGWQVVACFIGSESDSTKKQDT